jgi:hypothetical protein
MDSEQSIVLYLHKYYKNIRFEKNKNYHVTIFRTWKKIWDATLRTKWILQWIQNDTIKLFQFLVNLHCLGIGDLKLLPLYDGDHIVSEGKTVPSKKSATVAQLGCAICQPNYATQGQ